MCRRVTHCVDGQLDHACFEYPIELCGHRRRFCPPAKWPWTWAGRHRTFHRTFHRPFHRTVHRPFRHRKATSCLRHPSAVCVSACSAVRWHIPCAGTDATAQGSHGHTVPRSHRRRQRRWQRQRDRRTIVRVDYDRLPCLPLLLHRPSHPVALLLTSQPHDWKLSPSTPSTL